MILVRVVIENILRNLIRSTPATAKKFMTEAMNIESPLWAPASHYRRLPGPKRRTYAESYETSSEGSSESYTPPANARPCLRLLRSYATRSSGPCDLKLSSTWPPQRNQRRPTPPAATRQRCRLPAGTRPLLDAARTYPETLGVERNDPGMSVENGRVKEDGHPENGRPTPTVLPLRGSLAHLSPTPLQANEDACVLFG